MEPIKLTLPILNKFLELIVGYTGRKQIDDVSLLELIKFVDSNEDFWKVEENILYSKKEWLTDLDKIARDKRNSEIINSIKDERKRALKIIQYKLAEISGLDADKLLDMALSILHKRKTDTAALLGVDISELPNMPVNYIIIEGNIEYKL